MKIVLKNEILFQRIQFAGLPEDDEEEEEQECEPIQSCSGVNEEEKEDEIDESEIRATAEKVVQEVITKASETAAEKLENEVAGLSFPVFSYIFNFIVSSSYFFSPFLLFLD